MAVNLINYKEKAAEAVKAFWGHREAARQKQIEAGKADQGNRAAVTAGKNMDGFVSLAMDIVRANGLPTDSIYLRGNVVTLPGYFRATKKWDLLVVNRSRLVAVLEFKSQVGSVGKNLNNRAEEVIGNATDLWTAFREGAFGEASAPFVGWLMVLGDDPEARRPVSDAEPHYPVFPEFKRACRAERYNILCRKLVQEQLYTAASVILTPRTAVDSGEYTELSELTSLRTFVTELAGHVAMEAAR